MRCMKSFIFTFDIFHIQTNRKPNVQALIFTSVGV